jgi:hypothetical protein
MSLSIGGASSVRFAPMRSLTGFEASLGSENSVVLEKVTARVFVASPE